MSTLPSFPVHDDALTMVEHALGASLHFATTGGDAEVVGADFTLSTVMDFYSGYDEALCVPYLDDSGIEVPGVVEYPHPCYTRDDIISALITEVRRLRGS